MRWLRRLLTPAEDPRGIRDDEVGGSGAHEDPSALLARLETSIADLAAARARLEAMAGRMREASAEDPLSQRALGRVEGQLAAVAAEEREMRAVQVRLVAHLAELQARQAVVEARWRAAAAQVRVGEALAGLSEDFQTVAAAVERTQLRAEELKARAAALAGLGEVA